MSDSQWLVEFVLGLLNSVLNLPDGPVKFFGGIQITEVLWDKYCLNSWKLHVDRKLFFELIWQSAILLSLLLLWLNKASNWLINNNKLIINMYVKKFRLVTIGLVPATIPHKTTWESFPHHVHFPTQQNYFQSDTFEERKPLSPIQCCFLQTPRDQAFFWIHNITFRGRGRGKNRYSYDV